METTKAVIIDGVEYIPTFKPIPEIPEEAPTSVTPKLSDKEMDFRFLKSTRFWAMLLGVLSVYLESRGILGENERDLIASIAAIFIGINSFDRTVDKLSAK